MDTVKAMRPAHKIQIVGFIDGGLVRVRGNRLMWAVTQTRVRKPKCARHSIRVLERKVRTISVRARADNRRFMTWTGLTRFGEAPCTRVLVLQVLRCA